MPSAHQFVTVAIEQTRLAFPLEQVRRVVRAAEVTALHGAPPAVHGVVDIAGEVVAVVSPRRRLGLAERPVGAADQFVVVTVGRHTLAIVVDAAEGLHACAAGELAACAGAAMLGAHAQGVLHLPNGLALVTDAGRFLLPDESDALDLALAAV